MKIIKYFSLLCLLSLGYSNTYSGLFGDVASSAGRAVGDVTNFAGRAVEDVGNVAGRAVGDVTNFAGNTVGNVAGSAGRAVEDVTESPNHHEVEYTTESSDYVANPIHQNEEIVTNTEVGC